MTDGEFSHTPEHSDVAQETRELIDEIVLVANYLHDLDVHDYKKDIYDYIVAYPDDFILPEAVLQHIPNIEFIRLHVDETREKDQTIPQSMRIDFGSPERTLRIIREREEDGAYHAHDSVVVRNQTGDGKPGKRVFIPEIPIEELNDFLASMVDTSGTLDTADDYHQAFLKYAAGHEQLITFACEDTGGKLFAHYRDEDIHAYSYVGEQDHEERHIVITHKPTEEQNPRFFLRHYEDDDFKDLPHTPDLSDIKLLRSIARTSYHAIGGISPEDSRPMNPPAEEDFRKMFGIEDDSEEN